jgi:hypothetical protein
MQSLPEYIPEKAIPAPDDLINKDLTDHGFVHVHSWKDRVEHHIYRHEARKVDFYYQYFATRCVMFFPDEKQPGDLFVNLCRLKGAFTPFENTIAFNNTFTMFGILLLELGIEKPRPRKEKVLKKKEAVSITEPPKQEPQQDLFSF